MKGVLELMHHSLLVPNEEWFSFMKTLGTQASIAIDNAEMFDRLQRTNLDLSLAYEATIEGWSRAMEFRGHEKSGHSLYLADVTLKIAQEMGIPEEEWADIRRGVLLHDIGMIGLPDSILFKKGPLDETELEKVRQHPRMAYDLLSPITYLRNALEIPYNHHEYYDGSGYPRGINGQQIPLSVQIFTLVDIWDALGSDRPFREAWPKERVYKYLSDQAGKKINPGVYQTFMSMKI
jgi:HD-GYP domain-containing protein (c-di-GMP phosphodiesterase class II)